MDEIISHFPYDRSVITIVRQGGPIFALVILVSTCTLLGLLSRRLFYTSYAADAFYVADTFLLIIFLLVPVLYSLYSIPNGYAALQVGGIDSGWPLPMALQETAVLAFGTLLGTLVLLLCSAVQQGIRHIRKCLTERST